MQIDKIIHTRRKTISLMVMPDGRLVVRAPLRATKKQIIELVNQKLEWILIHQALADKARQLSPEKQYVNGECFWFLGAPNRLEIITGAQHALELKDGVFRLDRSALPAARQILVQWYRTQAHIVFKQRVESLAAQYGFKYKTVKITSAQTRWGSCSISGSLNFPWRLVMAPLEVIDYVVVHELVHTVIHNHSQAFWDKLRTFIPDFNRHRQWLYKEGGKLKV
jgi:predicted metal-dependent hydrolase